MTNDEAKFRLQGYRPNGADADNPAFAEALEHARRDPKLREWFEREQAFDEVVAAKLRGVAVPDGLRESILAGTKLGSDPVEPTTERSFWRSSWSWGLAAAAAVVLVASVILSGPGGSSGPGQVAVALPRMDVMLQTALREFHGDHPMGKHADELGAFGAWLEQSGESLSAATDGPLNLASLLDDGCRSIDVGGRQIFEICFLRNGSWYHVYIGSRADFDPASVHEEPMFHEQGRFVAASWADEEHVFLVSSTTSTEDLRRLL